MNSYADLARLAELELVAIRAGSFDELPALAAERARLLSRLPEAALPESRADLQRAADLVAEVIAELELARATTGRELGRLRVGRGAVRAYGHVDVR